ncbi:hypothetical protein FRC02_000500 [Tulasnella sp. 418]|nr:hypothetical protein FRC02_000500 [Tulasnella sp. 418]
MDRRKRTREIVTEELEHMLGRLEQLRDEEISYRERFFQDQGQYLPEDLCPFLADLPPKYLVQTIDDDLLPDLEPSFVAEARKNITTMEGIINSMERSNLA